MLTVENTKHIKELSGKEVEITDYRYMVYWTYPTWLVKCEGEWYRCNKELGRLMEKVPTPPLKLTVRDSGKEYKGNKIYKVEIAGMTDKPEPEEEDYPSNWEVYGFHHYD